MKTILSCMAAALVFISLQTKACDTNMIFEVRKDGQLLASINKINRSLQISAILKLVSLGNCDSIAVDFDSTQKEFNLNAFFESKQNLCFVLEEQYNLGPGKMQFPVKITQKQLLENSTSCRSNRY